MEIVTSPIDWPRLCELVNAPTSKSANQFTMQDIIDGSKIIKRARPVFPLVGTKTDDYEIQLSREFCDLSVDIIQRLDSGLTSTRAEFYLRHTPTVIKGQEAINAKINIQRKLKAYLNKQLTRRPTRPSTTFKYADHVDLLTVKGWWTALEEIYVLSRLAGMVDPMLPN